MPIRPASRDFARFRPRHKVPIALRDLVEAVGSERFIQIENAPDMGLEVYGVSLNTRTIQPGDVYLALPGQRHHGAVFGPDAVAAGAGAIVTDLEGWNIVKSCGFQVPTLVVSEIRKLTAHIASTIYPARPALLLGVTGTNGKTTVSYMMRSLLAALGRSSGLIGTVETVVGSTSFPSTLTTPESPDTHALLARMAEESLEAVAMEVSSHALSFGRVDGLVFDVAGFTNLAQDHLDLHGSMDEYLATKAQLFTAQRSRCGVITVDDVWGKRLASMAELPIQTLWTGTHSGYSAAHSADWRVTKAEDAGLGWNIAVSDGGSALDFRTNLPGRFNVANAALAVLLVLAGTGVAAAEMQQALDEYEPLLLRVPGRMEQLSARPTTIVDFAHNPDGLRQALGAVQSTADEGRLIVVGGATGERDRGKRPDMGDIMAQAADIVIVTDDDPHDEDPAQIRHEVLAGAYARAEKRHGAVRVEEVAPREAAIDRAVSLARPQDTIIVAGRGHETVQEIRGVQHPLDDRQELRTALTRYGFSPSDEKKDDA